MTEQKATEKDSLNKVEIAIVSFLLGTIVARPEIVFEWFGGPGVNTNYTTEQLLTVELVVVAGVPIAAVGIYLVARLITIRGGQE